jgi:hypothetical protein
MATTGYPTYYFQWVEVKSEQKRIKCGVSINLIQSITECVHSTKGQLSIHISIQTFFSDSQNLLILTKYIEKSRQVTLKRSIHNLNYLEFLIFI